MSCCDHAHTCRAGAANGRVKPDAASGQEGWGGLHDCPAGQRCLCCPGRELHCAREHLLPQILPGSHLVCNLCLWCCWSSALSVTLGYFLEQFLMQGHQSHVGIPKGTRRHLCSAIRLAGVSKLVTLQWSKLSDVRSFLSGVTELRDHGMWLGLLYTLNHVLQQAGKGSSCMATTCGARMQGLGSSACCFRKLLLGVHQEIA